MIYNHQGRIQEFRLGVGWGRASEQARSPESKSKSEGEELDLQANPVENSLNDCEID